MKFHKINFYFIPVLVFIDQATIDFHRLEAAT